MASPCGGEKIIQGEIMKQMTKETGTEEDAIEANGNFIAYRDSDSIYVSACGTLKAPSKLTINFKVQLCVGIFIAWLFLSKVSG